MRISIIIYLTLTGLLVKCVSQQAYECSTRFLTISLQSLYCNRSTVDIGNSNLICTNSSTPLQDIKNCDISCLPDGVMCGYNSGRADGEGDGRCVKYEGLCHSSEPTDTSSEPTDTSSEPTDTSSEPTDTSFVSGSSASSGRGAVCRELRREKSLKCENITTLTDEEMSCSHVLPEVEGLDCTCDILPPGIQRRLPECLEEYINDNSLSPSNLIEAATDAGYTLPNAINARLNLMIQSYGNVDDLLVNPVMASLLPVSRVEGTTLEEVVSLKDDILNLQKTSVKFSLTRSSLEGVVDEERSGSLDAYSESFPYELMVGVGMEDLAESGRDTAERLCRACRASDYTCPQAKVEIICNVIYESFTDFTSVRTYIMAGSCPVCVVYILKQRSFWRDLALRDDDVRRAVCRRIGSSFEVDGQSLSEWARNCEDMSLSGSTCDSAHPSMMVYYDPASLGRRLELCWPVLCDELCSLPPSLTQQIQQYVASRSTSDLQGLGCLAYMADRSTYPQAPSSLSIPGQCIDRSQVLQRYVDHQNGRQKRQTMDACDVFCDVLGSYQNENIPLPDILDINTLTSSCIQTDCIDERQLGTEQWNRDQALALLAKIKQEGAISESSAVDLALLGFVSLGLTPDELRTYSGITNSVYGVYGAVYGWHPDQLEALAERYLADNDVTPGGLTVQHVATLGHLICGFTSSQISQIPTQVIRDSTHLLGLLRQCRHPVLVSLADHLKSSHGPVDDWSDELFPEFGILLAGLSGREIRGVGLRVVEHLSIYFINHYPARDVRRISGGQFERFTFNQALAAERRNWCPHLNRDQKRGNIWSACNPGNTSSTGTHSEGRWRWLIFLLISSLLHTIRCTSLQ